jgi:hypothetical protein
MTDYENGKIRGILDGIGVVSEVLGAYMKAFLAQGFTRTEALQLCLKVLENLYKKGGQNENRPNPYD